MKEAIRVFIKIESLKILSTHASKNPFKNSWWNTGVNSKTWCVATEFSA